MKIYLLRHGETNWNLKRRIQGQTDIPLNSTGILQAQQCRAYFDQANVDEVYSSGLDRALTTARIATGRPPCIIPEFNERHYGMWQGRLSTELQQHVPNYSDYFRDAARRAPGGESLVDVMGRVEPILSGILAAARPDSQIVICSHGGTSKAIIGILLAMSLDTIPSLSTIRNGAVAVLSKRSEQWEMVDLPDSNATERAVLVSV